MSISSILALGACTSSGNGKADIIQNALQEKYGEKFVVREIGVGDAFPPSDYTRAYCHSERYPHKEFKVMLHKDGTVLDNYICVLLSERIEQITSVRIEGFFGDAVAVVEVDNNWVFISDKSPDDTIESFLSEYQNLSILTTIFAKVEEADGFTNERLNDLFISLSDVILQGNISVLFFEEFDAENEIGIYYQINSVTEKTEHYKNDDNCIQYSYISILFGRAPHILENLKGGHEDVKSN